MTVAKPGPRIALIYARAANGVIGRDGTMPWHLPEDLAHFRALTQGHPVVMGRKTWDSLPERFRPLPGRRNIVLTRQTQWQALGAERADSLRQALTLCEQAPEVWVIGGAQAPQLGAQWVESGRSSGVSKTGLGYSFVSLTRR